MRSLFLAAAFFTVFAATAAKVEISQDRPSALYRAGEEAEFTISVKDDTGVLVRSGQAEWTLDNFGSVKYATGKVELAFMNPFRVKGRMNEEGFLRLNVTACEKTCIWGVGYDVERIRQNEPCPVDFDEYWSSEKARLEKEVPLDPKMKLDAKLSTKTVDCYRVNFATFNGKRIYGFLSVPKDKSKAPFRVRVWVPGAGPGCVKPPVREDEITLTLNVHTFEPEKTIKAQEKRMHEQNRKLADKFNIQNKSAYCALAGISSSREDYWYHDVMLGINRAVDWVCARDDADLSQVTYFGSSQGGGFGLFLNYLNSHFTKAFVAVCAITGHYGFKQNRQNGWPNLFRWQPDRAAAEKNGAYFDGVNFAARIKHPIRFIVGFADNVCAPTAVYAAYNVCPSKDKAIVNAVGSSHDWRTWQKNNKGKAGWMDFDKWLRTR